MQNSFHKSSFDYVICGGGTAGCVLAARLAAIPHTTVLLVEGGRDSGQVSSVEVPGKYVVQLDDDKDGLWELPTVPQRHLNDRTLKFLRGRQLGGSSAVNYMALARGPAADYDQWAAMVGDDRWKWEHILPLMKELEDFDPTIPRGMEKFAQPESRHHGQGGPLKVGFGREMVPGVNTFVTACGQAGIPICFDNNCGNPIGVGLAQCNVRDGKRSYAANAFLPRDIRDALPNLTILTGTECDKVHVNERDGVAVGVDLYDTKTGHKIFVACRREVILSAGTFGSPKILMLSGIGPRDILRTHGIPIKIDAPGCGQNMLDHSIITLEYKVDNRIPAHNQIFLDDSLLARAEAEYAEERAGPLAMFGASGAVAFPKVDRLYESHEFHDLDPETQEFLSHPTRPSAEVWLGSGPSAFNKDIRPEDSYITHEMLLQNNLSRGAVTLSSSNPREPPQIDPNFLSHPFDKRIAIETVRMALEIAQTNAYRGVIEKMVHGPEIDFDSTIPESVTDEAFLDFIRSHLGQGYHSLGSCRMGPSKDPMSVVDKDFRVVGTKNLRVADLSVCPILTSNHTQINAYLIAERCAQKVIEDDVRSSVGSARL